MSALGKVDSLWRYPVKSMPGLELDEAFVGFSGIYGDRLFAFRSSHHSMIGHLDPQPRRRTILRARIKPTAAAVFPVPPRCLAVPARHVHNRGGTR